MEMQSLFETFVKEAWEHQYPEGKLPTKGAEDFQQYLVHVLIRFFKQADAKILSLPLIREAYQRRGASFANIQEVGDAILFRTGIHGISIVRSSLVSIDCYVEAGELAYGTLAVRAAKVGLPEATIFATFAHSLTPYVNVFIEVGSEHIVPPSPEHRLQVCARYSATKSLYDRAWLLKHGITLPDVAQKRPS